MSLYSHILKSQSNSTDVVASLHRSYSICMGASCNFKKNKHNKPPFLRKVPNKKKITNPLVGFKSKVKHQPDTAGTNPNQGPQRCHTPLVPIRSGWFPKLMMEHLPLMGPNWPASFREGQSRRFREVPVRSEWPVKVSNKREMVSNSYTKHYLDGLETPTVPTPGWLHLKNLWYGIQHLDSRNRKFLRIL